MVAQRAFILALIITMNLLFSTFKGHKLLTLRLVPRPVQYHYHPLTPSTTQHKACPGASSSTDLYNPPGPSAKDFGPADDFNDNGLDDLTLTLLNKVDNYGNEAKYDMSPEPRVVENKRQLMLSSSPPPLLYFLILPKPCTMLYNTYAAFKSHASNLIHHSRPLSSPSPGSSVQTPNTASLLNSQSSSLQTLL